MPSKYLEDGHPTTILVSGASTLAVREREVTPPGVDGGPPNEVTSMRNVKWTTFTFQKLMSLTPVECVVFYKGDILTTIIAQINVNQLHTATQPDGTTIAFWGAITSFRPNRNVKGEPPTATMVISPSNRNASDVETDPVITPPA
jgi:hypothetical protein